MVSISLLVLTGERPCAGQDHADNFSLMVRDALKAFRGLAVLFIAVAVVACGGGSGVAPTPHVAQKDGKARFTITVPNSSSTTNASRRPQYVSANAKSASVSVNGGAATIVQLTSGSSNCSTGADGLQCSISVTAPVGSDTFAISLYASTDGTGTALASQSITATIGENQTTPVNVTLDGVVSAISLALSTSSPTEGSACDITLTVSAQDASGATIIGPGNYSSPIAISTDDTSGATALSATQVTSPSANTVTVHYTGAHVVAHFTASAGSVQSAAVTLQSVPAPTPTPSPTPTETPTPTPTPVATPLGVPELLWVANNGGQSVIALDTDGILQGTAQPSPVVTIAGSSTQFSTYVPQCVQGDPFGDVYVVGSQGSKMPGAIMYFPGAAGPVPSARLPKSIFGPGGDVPPAAILAGGNTLLSNPVGCAFDNSGNLWVANVDDFNDSVVMFTQAQLKSGGDVAPARIIHPVTCCGNSSLCNTISLTFDPNGNLWTGSLCAPTAEFAASDIATSGSPTPIAWFGQAAGVNAMVFDSGGNLWTSLGSPINEITEFYASSLPKASSGNLGADVTVSSPMLLGNAFGIDFDENGNLWVVDQTFNILYMFTPASMSTGGEVVPSAIVSGASTTLNGPVNIRFVPFIRGQALSAHRRAR